MSRKQNATPWPSEAKGPVALVVDDEPLVRQLVTSVLRRHGWRVVEAKDAATAIVLASDEPVDLVITDHEMPATSGLELAAIIRRRRPSTPILVISGFPGVAEDVLANGFGFLAKPFSLDTLIATIEELMARFTGEAEPGQIPAGAELNPSGGMNF